MQFQNTGKREHGKSYTDSQSFLPNVMYLTSASMARASHMALPNLKDGRKFSLTKSPGRNLEIVGE